MKKEYRKAYNEAKKVFQKLDYIFSGVHFGQYFKQLFNMNYTEEKNHQNRRKNGLTVKEGAVYFSVKDLAECIQGKNPNYSIKNILTIRPSVLFAHSIFLNYHVEVKKAFEGVNIELINSFDYAEAMKTE